MYKLLQVVTLVYRIVSTRTCCFLSAASSPPSGAMASSSFSFLPVQSESSSSEVRRAFQCSVLFSRRFLKCQGTKISAHQQHLCIGMRSTVQYYALRYRRYFSPNRLGQTGICVQVTPARVVQAWELGQQRPLPIWYNFPLGWRWEGGREREGTLAVALRYILARPSRKGACSTRYTVAGYS